MRDFRDTFAESLGCSRGDFFFANYEGRDVLFLITTTAARYLQALLAKPTEQWPESARWLRANPQVVLHFDFDRFSGTFLSPGETAGLSQQESSVKAAAIHWLRIQRIERILSERFRSGPRSLRLAVSTFFNMERHLVLTSRYKAELQQLGILEGSAASRTSSEGGEDGEQSEGMSVDNAPVTLLQPGGAIPRTTRSGRLTTLVRLGGKRVRTDSPGSKGEKNN